MVVAESTEALGRAIADPSSFLTNAWLIAFLPAMAALFTLVLGKRTPGKGSVYGIAAVGALVALTVRDADAAATMSRAARARQEPAAEAS